MLFSGFKPTDQWHKHNWKFFAMWGPLGDEKTPVDAVYCADSFLLQVFGFSGTQGGQDGRKALVQSAHGSWIPCRSAGRLQVHRVIFTPVLRNLPHQAPTADARCQVNAPVTFGLRVSDLLLPLGVFAVTFVIVRTLHGPKVQTGHTWPTMLRSPKHKGSRRYHICGPSGLAQASCLALCASRFLLRCQPYRALCSRSWPVVRRLRTSPRQTRTRAVLFQVYNEPQPTLCFLHNLLMPINDS